nr:uncharacterized protein LOC127329497 [Lolium perenne]
MARQAQIGARPSPQPPEAAPPPWPPAGSSAAAPSSVATLRHLCHGLLRRGLPMQPVAVTIRRSTAAATTRSSSATPALLPALTITRRCQHASTMPRLRPPRPEQAKQRFPRITADQRGPCRKRPLDKVDPDPFVHWTDLKMGRTHTSRPDAPSTGPQPQVHEHVAPLQAEVGHEFPEKLNSQGKKNKAPAPDAGSSQAPPAKRSRTEVLGGKEVGKRRYKGKTMPVSSGPALKLSQGATSTKPESSEGTARTSPPPRSSPDTPDARSSPKTSPAPPPEAPTAKPTGAVPTPPPSQGPSTDKPTPPPEGTKLHVSEPFKGKATASGTSAAGSQSLVLHVGPAAAVAGEKATGLLGRITELKREGRELGHLLDYAEKWNQADVSAATHGLGKDRLPAIDPAGPRCNEEHFMRLRRAVKEFDNVWHDATNNVVVTIPEASIEALKTQLATLQGEKEQLIREHREALDAEKLVSRGLKDQLIQLGLKHSEEMKAAGAAAEARLNDALEDANNSTAVLRAELEEGAKAWQAAEDRAARLEAEQKEYDQLVIQTDALAFRLFPDSQPHAQKKVAERRVQQAFKNLDAPWGPYDHLVALSARVAHMRAVDRNLADLPDVAIHLFKVLWPEEEVPASLTLTSNCLKGAGRRIREWQ